MTQNFPIVCFMLPLEENYGDTIPLIEIAKKYIDFGGKAIFIGYVGEYEELVKNIGCKFIKIEEKIIEKIIEISKQSLNKPDIKNRPHELYYRDFFRKEHEKYYVETINQEIEALKKENIELVVSTLNLTSFISVRAANIPLINVISGVTIPPYFKSNYATYPDNFENFFTHLIPNFIKNRLINWYTLKCKWGVKGFNSLAKKYNIPPVKLFLDILYGDYTLLADNINFLNLKPTSDFPRENFVGPILPHFTFKQEDEIIDIDIENNLKKPGKNILFTLGSSGSKKILLDILKVLNKTNYNVVANYSIILNKEEIPDLNNNIILKKFIPSIKKIHDIVDLAIIHGGRGTVYNVAYSGKPAIGIPMHSEQQHNLDILVRHGSAIRLSKKYFKEKHLLQSIEKIFENYDSYIKKAQILKEKLKEENGAENAVKRILEIAKLEKNDKFSG